MNIPGYEIRSVIGRGGTATVYLAVQESLERKVALKVMSPSLGEDPSFRERFLKEGRIIGRLAHPHIVTVYDIGCHDNLYYMAMQFIGGGSLKDRLAQRLTAAQALEITRQVASALGYAHAEGFIHRDVKPGNILFRDDESTVLSDFGIAKAVAADTQLTAAGWTVGTPDYMSPEQAMGKEVGPSCDLYSLGGVLYEMLTGSRPYEADTAIATALKHLQSPVPTLPGHLAPYQPLIDRLLAKKPEERFTGAAELIAEIDRLLPVARQAARTDQTEATTLNPTADAVSNRLSGEARLIPYRALGVGLALVITVAVIVTLVTADRPSREETYRDTMQVPRQQRNVTPPLTTSEVAKVERLLAAAEAHAAVGRILRPPGSNAYDAYRMVLEIDPQNADAKRGIAEIERLPAFDDR